MALIVFGLVACHTPTDTAAPLTDADSAFVALDAARLARRTSLDLRGRLPSLAELDAVEADPEALRSLRADWMHGEPFEERFSSLLAERWLVRVDDFLINSSEYTTLRDDETLEYTFERSVADEPLRLMAYVASADLPWTDVVTADYTVANGLLASIWPLEHPGGEAWEPSRYTDGRPAAGVLATNGLWIRYYTTDSNRNRRRAALIADVLLCEDYLNRPVAFDAAAGITGDPEEALRTNPYCLGCHSSLDPMAALLFGFYPANPYNVDDVSTYHAEREAMGPLVLGVDGAYYGTPVAGLGGLGQAIAADPRFARCTAQTMAALLWRRPTDTADFDRITTFQEAYDRGDQRMSALLEAIVADPVYTAGGLVDGADPALAGREHLARMMSPDALASSLREWAGLEWTYAGFEQLGNDEIGYRVLAGGVDGTLVTEAQSTPGLTWELTVRRVAQAAAAAAIEQGRVDATVAAGDPTFEPALVALHRELLASRPDAARIADLTALWEEVAAATDGPTAWAAVIEYILRDPLFVTL